MSNSAKCGILGSKAAILRVLSADRGLPIVVDPFVAFDVGSWRRSPDSILEAVAVAGLGGIVIVRSAAQEEDSDPALFPGAFRSTPDVEPTDTTSLRNAIEGVIASYERYPTAKRAGDHNEVIVQQQLVNVRCAGVMDTGGPGGLYVIVQFDDRSGRTDQVTRGLVGERAALARDEMTLPQPWGELRDAAVAVEAALGRRVLIEFALTSDGQVHVFQARPYREANGAGPAPEVMRRARDLHLGARARVVTDPGPWSDMADWNPAELLGDRPRPLAISLYRYLVTDSAWITGRASLGYRGVEPKHLVESICGKPYVNVRRSFLSLTPSALSPVLAERILGDRIEFLRSRPELHDKVELAVLFTISDPCKPPRTNGLLHRGFGAAEVSELNDQLRVLTGRSVNQWRAVAERDEALTSDLLRWREEHAGVAASASGRNLVDFISTAMLRCKDSGVVPFARQARQAFIARDLLDRLVAGAVLDPAWLDGWWRSVDGVTREVVKALGLVASGSLSRDVFNVTFGHLRQRTFDIECPRYAALEHLPRPMSQVDEQWNSPRLDAADDLRMAMALSDAGVELSTSEFLAFARYAVTAREQTKFGFTAVLSDIIEAAARLAAEAGLSREDISFVAAEDLLAAMSTADALASGGYRLRERSEQQRVEWYASNEVELPEIVFSELDLRVVRSRRARPNFITTECVIAEVAVLGHSFSNEDLDLAGKIVVVEAADPGLDWLFTQGIAGLVTKYGGALSHVAVRCRELGVPAAIGCGDLIYSVVLKARLLCLDCDRGRLDAVERPAS